MLKYAPREQQHRYGADAYRHVHQQQAAGDDSRDEDGDRNGNEESAEPDHMRSPLAVRVTRLARPCC
jgi:hypothetical protein